MIKTEYCSSIILMPPNPKLSAIAVLIPLMICYRWDFVTQISKIDSFAYGVVYSTVTLFISIFQDDAIKSIWVTFLHSHLLKDCYWHCHGRGISYVNLVTKPKIFYLKSFLTLGWNLKDLMKTIDIKFLLQRLYFMSRWR